MNYQEPVRTFFQLHSHTLENNRATLIDTNKIELQVSYLNNFGWEIEVRYDKVSEQIPRQIYTGKQVEFERQTLRVEETHESFIIASGKSNLVIDKELGSFSIKENGKVYLQTSSSPFQRHAEQKDLYGAMMSLKVPDFSVKPLNPMGDTTYRSFMHRFQYQKPHGLVLGLPGQTGEMNRSGYRFQLYNTDTFVHTPDRPPMYQSWPILFHLNPEKTGWVGVFHDNPSRTFVDVGDFYPENVTFESITGNTRVYICTGPTLEKVSQKITKLLGVGDLPPLWAFGYQQSRYSYWSTDELRKIITEFQQHDIPLDAVYLDIDYMLDFRVFTFNERFDDLPELIRESKQKGLQFVPIVDPGVKIDEKFPVFTDLEKTGAYLKALDNNPFVAQVWPGDVYLPDFGSEKARDLWVKYQSEFIRNYDFSGIWNDMNEPSNFDRHNETTQYAFTDRGSIQAEYNLYGYYMANASRLGWKAANPGKRGLVITRSGYPGVQQNAVIWHGDNHSWWEHLQLALQTAISYSMCGVFYTGADVPGFTGNPPDDLAVRFYQLGAFIPFYRGHSIFFAKDKEPYMYGEEANKIIRDAIRLRYSLLREWYSNFAHALQTKKSPLMPVLSSDSILIKDQMLLFDKFLFAPVMERDQTKRLVYLPEGEWYRFGNTDERFQGDQWMTLDVQLDTSPLFVKAGSVVIRNEVGRNTVETLKKEERYDIYPDQKGEARGVWYSDDGISIADPKAQMKEIVSSNNLD